MSFFMIWWRQQGEERKEVVKRLVKEGRLDFINGGYVQHDEAASHYVAMIDQTTRGHLFLKETFDFVPRIGWQIDPFGHSSTQAGLLGEQIGFDAMFFGRADHEDMELRKIHKMLEFVWQGSGGSSACSSPGIFTGNFASGNYGPPIGFNWEFGPWSDPPIQDDPSMEGYNVQDRVNDFVKRCDAISSVTKGNDIMLTMGSDFHYSNAHSWFKNLDKLIHYVNKDGRMVAFYSTPLEYVKAKQEYKVRWPVKVDDFFPYSDNIEAFWTGYFSSRPTSKRYIRQATSFLQATRQLEAYSGAHGETDILEEAVALCQHHDSITGTEKQHVADDYHMRIYKGLVEAEKVFANSLHELFIGEQAKASPSGCFPSNIKFCHLRNISICAPTVRASVQSQRIMVMVYNSLGFERQVPVRMPVSKGDIKGWVVQGEFLFC